MTVILLHQEETEYASRRDVAILEGPEGQERISAIFTIGVINGHTVGSGNKPFKKGQTLPEVYAAVDELNRFEEDAVCLCGAYEEYHTKSAACDDYSRIYQIDLDTAFELSYEAKRSKIGRWLRRKLIPML